VGNRTDNRVELRILDARSLLELGDLAWFGGHQRGARPERGEVAADGARLVQFETIVKLLGVLGKSGWWERGFIFGLDTHDDVRHLTERLVRSVRCELVLTLGEVNGDERVRDVALLRDECYATRASGPRESVQCDRGAHDDCS
jgi:hypothetical protein